MRPKCFGLSGWGVGGLATSDDGKADGHPGGFPTMTHPQALESRLSGRINVHSCSACINLRTYKAWRDVCLRHSAYVLWNICDDWEQGSGPFSKFGLQSD